LTLTGIFFFFKKPESQIFGRRRGSGGREGEHKTGWGGGVPG
jgi:hypothetical protein